MKHLFRKGLLFGMGWYLGKSIIIYLREAISLLIRYYVPQQYWDENDPEHPSNKNIKKKNVQTQNPIGFRKD